MKKLLRPALAALLALLVLGPGLVRKLRTPAARPATGSSVPAEGSLRFREVSREAGLDFLHQAPRFDSKLENIMALVASVGAAVSIADFDGDGWDDLYVTNSAEGSHNRLYRNQGDGAFLDVAAGMGVADVNRPGTGVSMGSVWGDYDNDGFEDLFLYKYGRPELFRNQGGKGFLRVTETAGLPGWANANSALWLDFDGDGLLDLFLAGYFREDLDFSRLKTTAVMPESFEYARNGGRKYLLRNLGGGCFKDVTSAAGIDSRRWTLASLAADFDDRGRPDLFLANDYGVSELWLNQGGGRFREAGKRAGIAKVPKSGMSASLGDVANRGEYAIYVTNITEDGILVQGNNLWMPRGMDGEIPLFVNLGRESGVDQGAWSWGAQFGDLDNDGRLDLFLTNGFISGESRDTYWYDYSQITNAHGAIIADAANWPVLGGRSLGGRQAKRVWMNRGGLKFVDVAAEAGVDDRHDGRAVALADFRNRGALDVAVANQKGPLLLYSSLPDSARHWLAFRLEGRKSNRSAIGARVTLHFGDARQSQDVSGGSGFSSQNSRRLHFGLGAAQRAEMAVIRWPAGGTDTLRSLAADSLYRVVESP